MKPVESGDNGDGMPGGETPNSGIAARLTALEGEVERLRSLLAEMAVLQTEVVVAALRLARHVEDITPRGISFSLRAREAHTRLRRLATEAPRLMEKLVPIEPKAPDAADGPEQGQDDG